MRNVFIGAWSLVLMAGCRSACGGAAPVESEPGAEVEAEATPTIALPSGEMEDAPEPEGTCLCAASCAANEQCIEGRCAPFTPGTIYAASDPRAIEVADLPDVAAEAAATRDSTDMADECRAFYGPSPCDFGRIAAFFEAFEGDELDRYAEYLVPRLSQARCDNGHTIDPRLFKVLARNVLHERPAVAASAVSMLLTNVPAAERATYLPYLLHVVERGPSELVRIDTLIDLLTPRGCRGQTSAWLETIPAPLLAELEQDPAPFVREFAGRAARGDLERPWRGVNDYWVEEARCWMGKTCEQHAEALREAQNPLGQTQSLSILCRDPRYRRCFLECEGAAECPCTASRRVREHARLSSECPRKFQQLGEAHHTDEAARTRFLANFAMGAESIMANCQREEVARCMDTAPDLAAGSRCLGRVTLH